MADEKPKLPSDYGPARAGVQDYSWVRDTALAGQPWTCSELPNAEGTGNWRQTDLQKPIKVTAASLREAVAECLADGGLRRDLQVLEQRAHLVETAEDDANIPWHSKDLDRRVHRAAFWLLHVGCRITERRGSGADKALRAGGRALRLLLADRRIRTSVDRAELMVGALALAAAGEVTEAAEAVGGLATAAPVDDALASFLRGDTVAAKRSAQGVMVRSARGSLHSDLAQVVAPLLDGVASGVLGDIDAARVQLGAIRERAAESQDSWTWWRARLLRCLANSLSRRLPRALTSKVLSPRKSGQIATGLARLGRAGLAFCDDSLGAALLAVVGGKSTVVVVDAQDALSQLLAAAVISALGDGAAASPKGIVVVVAKTAPHARAWHAVLEKLGPALGGARLRDVDGAAVEGAAKPAAPGDVLIGTPTAIVAELKRTDVALTALIRVGPEPAKGDGLSDENTSAIAAAALLLHTAKTAKARTTALVSRADFDSKLDKRWLPAKAKARRVERRLPVRAGVFFITEVRSRLAWRDAIGTLQPGWVVVADDSEGRPFPKGRNEAVAAAAVRFARLGPSVIVCASPRALAEVIRGVVEATRARDGVLSRHDWPHDMLQRFGRAARDHGLAAERIAAAEYGFPSWSRTDPAPLRMATEALIASHPARVAIVDLELPAARLARYSSVLFTASTGEAIRLDRRAVAEYARCAGIAGIDRQGLLVVAVDGRRARQQVVRDLKEADALIESTASK